MRIAILTGALLASCILGSQATFIITGLTAGSATLGGLILLKLAALKGLAIGSALSSGGRGRARQRKYRHKRSLEEFQDILLSASRHDISDCAKRLVCEVNGLPIKEFRAEEAMIAGLFNSYALDVSKTTVEFDLAAQIGKCVGIQQCSKIYKSCPHNRQKLMEIFKDPNLGNLF